MSQEAEQIIIGAMLHDPVIATQTDLLPADFTVETYRLAYATIQDMVAMSEPVDLLTVAERNPKLSLLILGNCIKACVSTANWKAYSEMIRKAARHTKAKDIATTLVQTISYEDNAIDEAIRGLMSLNAARRNYEYSMTQTLKAAIDLTDKYAEMGGKVGITTGIERIDGVLGGFHPSDLYVVGARPSMGKTAFLLNLAVNSKAIAGIITAEQPYDQVGFRLVSITGSVPVANMRNGTLDEDGFNRISVGVSKLSPRSIWIYDQPAPSITDIVRQARKWKLQHGLQILFVDYIQRVRWHDQKLARHEQVGNVVMALKELARELQIPVVAASQVNREVDKRPDSRPGMGDLSNSSEIEKEADCIITLYRDEVYDTETSDKGMIEINVCKNRHGPTGLVRAVWLDRFMQVKDYTPEYGSV